MQVEKMVPLAFVLLLCLFGSIEAQGSGDINLGPVDHVCIEGGAEANPDACNQYFLCYTIPNVTLWQCKGDFLFDLSYNGCNFPINVDCGSRKRPDQPTVAPTTPRPAFQCPSSDGLFPVAAENHCLSTYYMCIENVAYVQTCPGNTVFDTKECKSAESAGCQVPTTQSPSEFTCPQSATDDYYPSPTSCQQFYRCVGGKAFIQTCPPTLVYNPVVKMCDWPANVPSCSSMKALPNGIAKVSNNEFTCADPNGTYTDPTDCNRYYVCIDSRPVANICPAGLYYDAANAVCNYPELVKCDADQKH